MAVSRRKRRIDRVSVAVSNVVSKVTRTLHITKKGEKLQLDTQDPKGLKLVEGIRATKDQKELVRYMRSHREEIETLPEEVRQVVKHQAQAHQHRFFYPDE